MNIDLLLFNAINRFAKKSKFADVLAIFFAEYAGYIFMAFLFVFAYTTDNWQIFFIPLVAGLFSRFIINEIVYAFYQRKRPTEVMQVNLLIKKPNHPAFPSGHTSFFFGISLSLLAFNFPLAIAGIAISSMVSFSRIFSGVHWPSDILAGIGAAIISFLVVTRLLIIQ